MANNPDIPRRDSLARLSIGLPLAAISSGTLHSGAFARVAASSADHSIRSCIFVFFYGGPSHLEMWDPKPDAPASVRGEFSPIETTVPGIYIGEHLPAMARVMHHCAIVRSMHHGNRLHDSASIETFTGRPGLQGDREEFAPIPQFYPSHGAMVSRLLSGRDSIVRHAALPHLIHNVVTTPCQGGGFLGSQLDPFLFSGDSSRLMYRIEGLEQLQNLDQPRIAARLQLLQRISTQNSQITVPAGLSGLYQNAADLLQSELLRSVMDLESEPIEVRERYGMSTIAAEPGHGAAAAADCRPIRGQNLLLARRLVEAGIPFVNVNDFRQQGQNWDSHADNFTQHRRYLLPQADQALAALIEDLHERGLLESTLVIAAGEFGRTPQINGNAGRDHWPDCYSVLLAGGGINGGQVYGASDKLGAYPDAAPTTPADLAATILWRFGISPQAEIIDRNGRPHRASSGEPLLTLFS